MKLRYFPILFAAIIALYNALPPKNELPYFADVKDIKTGILDTLNTSLQSVDDDSRSL